MNKTIKVLTKTIWISFIAINFIACENTKETVTEITKEKTKKVKLPKPEWDSRLSAVELSAGEWYQDADNYEIAAFNIGTIYSKQIKDYNKALEWYFYSDSLKRNKDVLFNIAHTYRKLGDYINSEKYFKKSFDLGDEKAASDLGIIYEDLNKINSAEIWYKKAIEKGSLQALKNISNLYHFKIKNDMKASAYLINLIAYPEYAYKKEKTINYLKNKWKIPNETIRKGYELQLTMPGLPKRYKGDLGLE